MQKCLDPSICLIALVNKETTPPRAITKAITRPIIKAIRKQISPKKFLDSIKQMYLQSNIYATIPTNVQIAATTIRRNHFPLIIFFKVSTSLYLQLF